MEAKVCLVTGSTDGIGLEVAKELARQGDKVFIHGRNKEKGAKALALIKRETSNQDVEFIQADFSSLEEVRFMAGQLNARLEKLDVLVNNAGAASSTTKLHYAKEGYEFTFTANHLAPFLLTNLLIDKLKYSGRARIVNVSSVGHKMAPFDIDDLMTEKSKPGHAYFRSKFANILFSNELARRFKDDGITSNALHPGVIRSNFGSEDKKIALVYKFAAPFMKSVKQGAATLIYLASSTEIEGQTGGYYVKCKLEKPAKETNDIELAQQLWQKSTELVRLGLE